MKICASLAPLALLAGIAGIAAAAASTPDCSQTTKCLTDYEPICGSDGKTYANECVFNNAVCRAITLKLPPLTELFEGPCTLDPNPFCNTACPKDYNPVCGTDEKTYSNRCTLRAAKCKDLLLEVAYEGECRTTPTPSQPQCKPGCPEILKPVCGSDGVTYDNQCLLDFATCSNPSQNITKTSDGRCGCPKGCPKILLPVCGSDGHTYDNKCLLENAACVNLALTLAHDGAC